MKHKKAPFKLVSKRIVIRPYKKTDARLLNKAVIDSFPQLHEWMDWAIKVPDLDETKSFIAYSQKCWSEGYSNELPLGIFDKSEKKLIGAISFNAINWNVPTFEIGYWVNTQYGGQGLITEAVAILSHYAFSKWKAKRIEVRCDTENVRSAAIPERLGFMLEAHFKKHRIQPFSKKLSGTLIFVRYNAKALPKIHYVVDD